MASVDLTRRFVSKVLCSNLRAAAIGFRQPVRSICTSERLFVKERRIKPKVASKLSHVPDFVPDVHAKVTPVKLHMVQRIKSMVSTLKAQKAAMCKIGLDAKLHPISKVVIMKNTPEMNKILWSIKHLIRVTPVTFPQGLPDLEQVESGKIGCLLTEQGEFIISEGLAPHKRGSETDPDKLRKIIPGEVMERRLRHSFFVW